MFLHALDEGSRSVDLMIVGGVAVEAGNLIDSVGCEVRRRILLRLVIKEIPQGCREVVFSP